MKKLTMLIVTILMVASLALVACGKKDVQNTPDSLKITADSTVVDTTVTK